MNAERWEDAADNYRALDYFINWNNEKLYLEELYAYYFPKFRTTTMPDVRTPLCLWQTR